MHRSLCIFVSVIEEPRSSTLLTLSSRCSHFLSNKDICLLCILKLPPTSIQISLFYSNLPPGAWSITSRSLMALCSTTRLLATAICVRVLFYKPLNGANLLLNTAFYVLTIWTLMINSSQTLERHADCQMLMVFTSAYGNTITITGSAQPLWGEKPSNLTSVQNQLYKNEDCLPSSFTIPHPLSSRIRPAPSLIPEVFGIGVHTIFSGFEDGFLGKAITLYE